jgi:hypothetical protein
MAGALLILQGGGIALQLTSGTSRTRMGLFIHRAGIALPGQDAGCQDGEQERMACQVTGMAAVSSLIGVAWDRVLRPGLIQLMAETPTLRRP